MGSASASWFPELCRLLADSTTLLCCCVAADPLSGQPLSSDQLVPNLVLRDMIHAWLQEDPSSSSSSSAEQAISRSASQPVSRSVSPSKGDQLISITGKDSGVLREAVTLTPGTPVRKSRDV